MSIEFSFNDRSNVIYESKQDEEKRDVMHLCLVMIIISNEEMMKYTEKIYRHDLIVFRDRYTIVIAEDSPIQ